MRTMRTINRFRILPLLAILFAGITAVSCGDDDDAPAEEDEVEVITNVGLIFTNTSDPSDVVIASAVDPDGEGILELEVLNPINLAADTEYMLTFTILNALDPNDAEDIGEEILEEDDEHQIFYSFTAGTFESPMGNGNIDSSADPVNYNDMDDNGNPVGLSTTWITSATAVSGTFTTRLQHQPGEKSDTTGASDGDTDFDLEYVINIME